MNRFYSTFLLIAGLAVVADARAQGYRRLYVFGDSYSDIGAGYIDGNGPTAVAYLAEHLGLVLVPPQAPGSAAQSIDFAVSGAQTGEGAGRKAKDAFLGYGMKNQVRDFSARVRRREIRFDVDRTLFFIAGGLNDKKFATEVTVENLHQEIGVLRGLGARHFTLALLPTKIPAFAAVGQRLNPALIGLVQSEQKKYRSDIWLNHWGADFDEVMDHPAQYGIVNTTDACAGRVIFDQDPTPKGDPKTFYYYHAGHPSTAVHHWVGEKLAAELADHPPAR